MKTSTLFNRTQALWQKAIALVSGIEINRYFLVGFIFACLTLPASARLSKEVELYHWVDFSIEVSTREHISAARGA